jgi:hypothetical protein
MTWNAGTNKFDVPLSQWTTSVNEIYNNNTGNVGIGAIPVAVGSKLQITGSVYCSSTVSLSSTSNTAYWWSGNGNTFLGRAATAGVYSSLAAVGDLVLSSDKKLILKTGVTASGGAIIIDNSANSFLQLHKTTVNTLVKLQLTDATTTSASNAGLSIFKGTDQNGYLWNYQDNALIFGTNNTERMRITGGFTGTIGIGTSNPSSSLHIHRNFTDYTVSILLTDLTTTESGGRGFSIRKEYDQNATIMNHENKAISFGTNNTERMRIENNGDVSISNNLSVGGTNIHSIIKDKFLFNVPLASSTFYLSIGGNFYITTWNFMTNLLLNEYGRPQLNFRWRISGNINNSDPNDSNKFFFANIFYNQLGNSFQVNITHSNGSWTITNFWGPQGDNYLRISVSNTTPATYLNINIS